ncbi:hypothetical protein swp_2827 [Shewanella piezotolerans WP3]|uniref:Uncharacterized protein n=1 Tax=Shewanella piezotolerans (strain WP3 / JCM 13877) TaxID=225849 RepID=B8CPH8_SHEPW|nr:hypothetical protein swp_2827 [Shewanella piezotolerans WP3]
MGSKCQPLGVISLIKFLLDIFSVFTRIEGRSGLLL